MYTHTDREHPHTKHGQTIARVTPCMHVQTSSNTVYTLKYRSKTFKRYSNHTFKYTWKPIQYIYIYLIYRNVTSVSKSAQQLHPNNLYFINN